ncbi:unnamed protein product [Ranitomeya imitator]|uniref:Extracellular matrix protein 1-like n=1 Tax=Ranitomeya imitator TaxID=111125 RepID=A0ABN9L0R4_9NEOB|nr:unnamed protein product [Ranitomeya imitator]
MDSRYQLSELAFPPGEPKSGNIQNICKLRKYRPLYSDNMLPDNGYNHYVRRAKAIQRMEGEFKKCCKTEDVACAHSGWKKVLGKFCAKEQMIKTKHHECCKKRDQSSVFSCFASEAPFPEYDREVEVLNLGNIMEDVLQKLCAESKLLTKQKQLPLLVSSLREMCCSLPVEEQLLCAAEQPPNPAQACCSRQLLFPVMPCETKTCDDVAVSCDPTSSGVISQGITRSGSCQEHRDEREGCGGHRKKGKFMKILCGAKKDSWKDTQDCCSKDEPEQEQCFTYYLQSVSVAVAHRTRGE